MIRYVKYFFFSEKKSGVPRCIRMDTGTENGTVANMQKAFRWFHEDTMSKEKSVIIGSSHTNQVGIQSNDLNMLFLTQPPIFCGKFPQLLS